MLYRWTCGLHVRHDETLPGCCALIHAVQVVPIDEADVDGGFGIFPPAWVVLRYCGKQNCR